MLVGVACESKLSKFPIGSARSKIGPKPRHPTAITLQFDLGFHPAADGHKRCQVDSTPGA